MPVMRNGTESRQGNGVYKVSNSEPVTRLSLSKPLRNSHRRELLKVLDRFTLVQLATIIGGLSHATLSRAMAGKRISRDKRAKIETYLESTRAA